MTNTSYSRFFRPRKSPQPTINGDMPVKRKPYNVELIWNSKRYGTYIRKKHGEIKSNSKNRKV